MRYLVKPTGDVYIAAATAAGSAMPTFTAKLPACRRAVDVGFEAGIKAERDRIIRRLEIDIANYGAVGSVNFADLIEWIEAAS